MARRKPGSAPASRRSDKTAGRPASASNTPPPGSDVRHRPGNRPDTSRIKSAGKGRSEPPDPDLMYGHHALRAALGNPRRRITALWCTEETATGLTAFLETLPAARRDRLPRPEMVTRADLDQRLPSGAVHQGWLARVEPLLTIALEELLPSWNGQPSTTLVVLDQVTDPHNVGAVLRSAAAFGAQAVIVQDRHTPPTTASLAKTASGAMDVVPLIRVTNLARTLRTLQDAGFWCVGLAEQGSRTLDVVDLSGRTALVLGSEGDGLRRLTRDTCDVLARLPTVPPIASLNVSAAAAIALYQTALARKSTN